MKIYCNNKLIADQVAIADDFLHRFIGLMGKNNIRKGEGLLLRKCSSIHCFFMKFPIDAVYLTEDMRILWTETVFPWKFGCMIKGVKNTLELEKGAAKSLMIGDQLTLLEK